MASALRGSARLYGPCNSFPITTMQFKGFQEVVVLKLAPSTFIGFSICLIRSRRAKIIKLAWVQHNFIDFVHQLSIISLAARELCLKRFNRQSLLRNTFTYASMTICRSFETSTQPFRLFNRTIFLRYILGCSTFILWWTIRCNSATISFFCNLVLLSIYQALLLLIFVDFLNTELSCDRGFIVLAVWQSYGTSFQLAFGMLFLLANGLIL